MKIPERVQGERVIRSTPLGGGDIGDSCRLETAGGASWFCKVYRRPGMAAAEAAGLQELSRCDSLRIPAVAEVTDHTLVLEFIHSGPRREGFYARFGRALAQMHGIQGDAFGFKEDNFIGETPQINRREESWVTFFCNHRLQYQVDLALKRGAGEQLRRLFDAAHPAIENLLQDAPEPPALLHGDLWGGNHLADQNGTPVLIDPAVYYGHREADLAMTSLFGSFPTSFYDAYEKTFPRAPGAAQREPIYKLYHILNHYNLFGGAYLSRALSILRTLQP
ncbi:MAG: fructosamine kinase family protein [Fibrobacterota bacterium]